MTRQLWIADRKTGELLTPEEYNIKYPPANSANYVINDSMPPTEHMIDGRIYESKSAFRAVTKAHGCIEVGNEKLSKSFKPLDNTPDPLPFVKEAFKGFRE